MFGVGQPVVNIISREKGHRLVYREVNILVIGIAGSWNGEWEPLSFLPYCSIHAIAERFGKINRTRTGPE